MFREDIKEMEAVFLLASAQGYASFVPQKRFETATGAKLIEFRHGRFTVIDRYWVGLNNFSTGATLMFYESVAIWTMAYFGCYSKEVTPTLKAALRANYWQNVFYGGRGPKVFHYENLIYHNNADSTAQGFTNFRGIETIRVRGQVAASGWHRYHGGLLGKL